MISRLAAVWAVSESDAADILERLDVSKWAGGDPLDCITHAGTIDTGHSDMMHGHNGYWIADASTGTFCSVTNGDPVWGDWSEDTASDCSIEWGDMADALTGNEV